MFLLGQSYYYCIFLFININLKFYINILCHRIQENITYFKALKTKNNISIVCFLDENSFYYVHNVMMIQQDHANKDILIFIFFFSFINKITTYF